MFSGWTILGNGALNALNQPRTAALAQLAVPALAILVIFMFVDTLGVFAAVFGMLAGMAANILLVAHALRRKGLRLALGPILPSPALLSAIRTWSMLAFAALVASASVPINYWFAGTLDNGAISAWALGSKLIQFVAGVGGVAIGAVILPHLGTLVSRGQKIQLRNDLYVLLMVSTWISTACALAIFQFSEPFVVAIFEGGKATADEVGGLADILRLGSLQLPFIAATMLILKIAAVSGTSFRAVLAVTAGLAVNIALAMVFVPQWGVPGIATAAAIGAGVSAIYLLLATRNQSGLALTQIALLLAAWIALAGLCVALQYRSPAAAAASTLALLFLASAQWLAREKIPYVRN